MDDKAGRNRATALMEIDWNSLDKNKLLVYTTGLFTGFTAVLHPVSVVKTILQVVSHKDVERNALSIIKGLMKREGILGFYKGFGTVVIGTIPARFVFPPALEKTKLVGFEMVEPLRLSEPTKAALVNGIAGTMASICSQVFFTPIDVISQKLMVQGWRGHETDYSGGLDVARRIIKTDGVRGLYRGFGLAIATYSPSSGIWWASYGASQRMIWRFLGDGSEAGGTAPSEGKLLMVQGSGAIFATFTSTCLTTPLDTIKTRLQMTGHYKGPNAKQVVQCLIADGGWTGFYRGLGPRFFNMLAMGTSMILSYEYLKRVCALDG